MKSVLWDVLKADAYNDTRTFNDSNFRHDTAYAAMYLSVFNAHHVSWEQFMDSYDYYMTQPELLRSMIDSMSEKANRDSRKRGIAPSGNGNPAFRNNFPGTSGHPNFPQGQNGRPPTSPGHPGPPFNMTRRPGFTAPTPVRPLPGGANKPGPGGRAPRPGHPKLNGAPVADTAHLHLV